MEFNSLDAQREAYEAYIASQKPEGWLLVPDRYDDGGISGATLERPALKRLLSDIEAQQIDVVVVYKIDRLSRALMDFSSSWKYSIATASRSSASPNHSTPRPRWDGRIPAAEIESAVVDQLRALLRAPEIIVGTWRAAKSMADISEIDVRGALQQLDPLWDELFPAEQARIVQLLVERVDVSPDGADIRLRTAGLTNLVSDLRAVRAVRSEPRRAA